MEFDLKYKLIGLRGDIVKDKKSIRQKLTAIGILPIVFLSVTIFVLGVILIYSMHADIIRDELETSTHVLKGCFNLTVRGDYTYDGDVLKKGDVNISDSTMLYEIKNNSDVDTTIFWKDTRIITTVESTYGVSAVGTKASQEVVERVLNRGENYFSNNLVIGGMDYIGYYTPLLNEDETVVGMVFAGKQKDTVYYRISMSMAVLLVITLIVIWGSLVSWRRYSKRLVKDIELINEYLHNIADGDLNATIDSEVIQRKDEIGEIGIHATKMCGALKIMVEQDSLTLLYNRRICNRMLKNLVEEKKKFTVVMADIDWFKKINDQYGHACGDYILRSVSSIIKESVKGCGFASRWGGEEFLLIYELELNETRNKVETLLQTIRDMDFEYEQQHIHVTMTIGVKEMESDVSYEKIIKVADDNLYAGKRNGRNQIVY